MSNAPTNGGTASPVLNVLGQYIKDFSFENPNAPRSLGNQGSAPEINIQVNVNGRPLADADYEVELKIEGGAKSGANILFSFELLYCGVLRLKNIPQEQIHPIVMIQGPQLLFPFARAIIADAVRNGGFPPLYVDPIDFVGLYRSRLEQATQGGTAHA